MAQKNEKTKSKGSEPKVELLASSLMRSITWTFPSEIKRGDCTINAGAQFTLYENGATNWRCDIRSSDSGDEWDGDMRCLNNANTQLWSDHYHFDISDENVTKRWDESRGANEARANSFNEAARISFSCSC